MRWLAITFFLLCLVPIGDAVENGKDAKQAEEKQAVICDGAENGVSAPVVINECGQPDEDTAANKNGNGGESGIGLVRSYFARLFNDPTALFTALIFIVTLGLWIVAIRTARRQLRAYVTNLMDNHPQRTDAGYDITMGIHNYGETPAYKVHGWSQFKVITKDEWGTYKFAKAPWRIDAPRFTAFPDRSYAHGNDIKLSTAEVGSICEGESRLYLWGEIRYRDTFGKRKWSRFRVYFHIENGAGNWRYCDNGNEAN